MKICGLTREVDVDAAVEAGADAIGFVLYDKSPRCVSPERARELARRLPAFVTPVCLFVNHDLVTVRQIADDVGGALIQLHGDESPAFSAALGRPHLRAARIPAAPTGGAGFNLVEFAAAHNEVTGILLDALVDGYGGGGHTFNWEFIDWSRVPPNVGSRLVLSGGLTPANVTDGIHRVRPWAVDVSSGVEATGPDGQALKGIKDAHKMARFVAAVRAADAAPLS